MSLGGSVCVQKKYQIISKAMIHCSYDGRHKHQGIERINFIVIVVVVIIVVVVVVIVIIIIIIISSCSSIHTYGKFRNIVLETHKQFPQKVRSCKYTKSFSKQVRAQTFSHSKEHKINTTVKS
jgi:hypothetical protein